MDNEHTDQPLTLQQAWENAGADRRSADAVFVSLTAKIREHKSAELNDLDAHESARTLIGFYKTLINL